MTNVADDYPLDLAANRRGYALNRLCGSLRDEANRHRFLEDEVAYCEEFGLTAAQRDAVLRRDWTAMLDLGASIFYTYKLAMVDDLSMQYLGGVFTGMTAEEFASAMRSGGRNCG